MPTAKASSAQRSLMDLCARPTAGKPLEACEVLLKDHHEGYVDWAELERNQRQLAANAYGRIGGVKSGRGGRALLPGLLICGRCGRRLSVIYASRGDPGPSIDAIDPT
jgi:hypothetical protein